MVNIAVVGSQIPKIGDVFACSTLTTGQIGKRMARGDSAHGAGLERGIQEVVQLVGHVTEWATTVVCDENIWRRKWKTPSI